MFQIQGKHVKQDSLARAFHGHAHNCWCQLKYLATYVEEMGIEDLEGCLFGTILVNNYKQAVSILNTEKTVKYAMAQAGITEEMMEARLEEEKQQLVNLADRREKFKDVFAEGSTANETTRRHAKKNYDRAVETVQTTECRLSIEWIQAAELVTMRDYRRAINTIEGLVVKRILELTKVNQSGLAYKIRDHIAKALKARSKTIRNALNHYNMAAKALHPPGRLLTRAERESEIKAEDPVLAFFVQKFDNVQSRRLQAMKNKLAPAFTGTLQPGIWVSPPVLLVKNPEEQGTVPSEPPMPPMPLLEGGREDDEGSQDRWLLDDGSSDEDEGPDAEGEELSAVLEGVASLGVD
ncbi:hypothetical protein K438DRAFT_1747148 [Mycena galopus ATCC 62051]|nr:hypothetical protein K438DRAFT_1747148 [Mycena galopus ATCC 62051]